MKRRSFGRIAATFVLSLSATNSLAASVVEAALEDLKVRGPEAFLTSITKGSPVEGDKSVLSQSSLLASIGAYYGPIESWRILATCPIADRVKTAFFVVYYEKGPLFGYASLYSTAKAGDVVTKFFVHTDVDKVFPHGLASNRLCDG